MKYVLFCLAVLLLPATARSEDSAKTIYGVYERVILPEIQNKSVKAKLDTGAITTSLGASGIEIFEKDGQDFVKFTPQIENAKEMELPLVRHSNIKLRNDEAISEEPGKSRRPVVIMNICFNGDIYATEVNLTDRSNFLYPVLLGRASLTDFHAIVDPSQKYLSSPSCQ